MDGPHGSACLSHFDERPAADTYYNNNPAVPQLIDNIVREGGRGVANAKRFCNYTPKEAKLWEETFTEFSYEIRKLALKCPYNVVKRKMKAAAPADL